MEHRTLPALVPILAILGVSWLAALIVMWILRFVERRLPIHDHGARALLGGIRLPSILLVPLLIVLEALPILSLTEVYETNLERLLLSLVVAVVAWAATAALEIVTQGLVARYRTEESSAPELQVATRVALLSVALKALIWIFACSLALLIFPKGRSIGATLLASAGIIGLVTGVAARPVMENLIAGIQLALSQPFRLDDVLVVQGEYGIVEEITATYVVIRCWDRRRLVYPLTYFVANPFENWTRRPTELLGVVFLYVDYTADVNELRKTLLEVLHEQELWTGGVGVLQVVEAERSSLQLRALMSAKTPPQLFDLRCAVRERMVAYIQEHCPQTLPKQRILQSSPGAVSEAKILSEQS